MDNAIWGVNAAKNSGAVKSAEDVQKVNIEIVNNHMFFYNSIDFESALSFNKNIYDLANKLSIASKSIGCNKPVIHLHINSGGGFVHAGTSMMDTIINLQKDIDIYTYVEGRAASAATFMTCVGKQRYINKHAYMLIHQLSSGVWGSYHEIEDHKENVDNMMKMIKEVYKQYTRVPEEDIDEILKHDLYWDAEKCVSIGLVDYIV